MKPSARYVKIVEWSEVDDCYVGSAPGLLFGGCHGDDEQQVFEEICQIVEETIELYQLQGKPLPPPTSGRDHPVTLLESHPLEIDPDHMPPVSRRVSE